PDVVCGRIHVHGSHVHSSYDVASMVGRTLIATKTQRHKAVLCLCAFVMVTAAFAIEKEPLQEYRSRRERLEQRIKGYALVLRAAPDQELKKYQPEPNFYYLTGFDEPGAILLLDSSSEPAQQFLLLPARTPRE